LQLLSVLPNLLQIDMETTDREVLIDAIADCAKADGWANLAEVGVVLREKNIKYGKLSKFILNFSEIVETRVDETRQPPVAYARLIQ
jgi:hypothetical protein